MKTEVKCENCQLTRFMILDRERGVERPVCLPQEIAAIEELSGQDPKPVEICDTQHFEDKRAF